MQTAVIYEQGYYVRPIRYIPITSIRCDYKEEYEVSLNYFKCSTATLVAGKASLPWNLSTEKAVAVSRVFNRHFTTPEEPSPSSEPSPTLCDSGDKTSPSERVFLASYFSTVFFTESCEKNGLVYYMKQDENVKVHT
ncbi:hypothetical protein CEXT_337371 [Caerostris extrusa]|uniref:Uncharacterized protein n=1 Tax=Caerostris extrusa TaxID=172846 RepID=A0AAV4SUM9_CAEEX|nr:hypothetical protein CEXT_337371 [Caerostris extrusa]